MSTIWLVTKEIQEHPGQVPIRAFATEQEAERWVSRMNAGRAIELWSYEAVPFGPDAVSAEKGGET